MAQSVRIENSHVEARESDEETTDDEDLDAPIRASTKPGGKQSPGGPASLISSVKLDKDKESQSQPPRLTNAAVDMSKNDGFYDDADDLGEAHEKFKHGRKRKRTVKVTDTSSNKNLVYVPASTVVGKKRPRGRLRKSNQTKSTRVFGMSSEEDDDERIEAELPDYLKRRRVDFEERRKELKDAGLKLPPDYEGVDFSDDERLDELQERPSFTKLKPCADYRDVTLESSAGIIPAPIAQWLRDYQVKGATFLHQLFVLQRGGVLGDDMGLGKTIQVIAFLTAAFGKTGDERDAKRMRKMRRHDPPRQYPKVLIICPGTLMENWKTELHRWGWWKVGFYHGSTGEKENAMQTAKAGYLEIMITTYSTYRLNRDTINLVEWDCVIADECHQIKQPSSEVSIAMSEINALCRLGLTGTAIQNNYEDLWTLLNWTSPGQIGPLKSWKQTISEPLKLGQSHDATQQQLAKARSTAHKLVNNLLPRFFLRRMKTLIADQLPKKSDRVVFCPLTARQQEAYENFLESEKVVAIRGSTDLCECGSGSKHGWCCGKLLEDGTRWQNHVFPAIATLQRLCSHLASLIPSATEDTDAQSKALENLEICCPGDWRDLFAKRDNLATFTNREFCGKWRVLFKLLNFWHTAGDKVLVFSHSTHLLKMLQVLMSTTSFTVSYLDGSMSYADRDAAVNHFNASPAQFVFLISTRAGGTGLNITSANKVVVVDPNWNPAHDLQAQDRAYRIGQQRDVEVFRLVSAGTIEEIVYARQVYKQQQANIGYTASHERRYFRGVMDKKEQKGEIFGLKNLFTFHGEEGNVILREIVNATNVAESKAGVAVAGLDMDSLGEGEESQELAAPKRKRKPEDGYGNDDAMSQLANLIMSGETDPQEKDTSPPDVPSAAPPEVPSAAPPEVTNPKLNPISAILASAGVDYTHSNTDLLGPSRVEAWLGRHAAEAAAQHGSASGPEVLGKKVFASQSHQRPTNSDAPHAKFRPPPDVRRRLFCEMARRMGWRDAGGEVDVTGFALAVEVWDQRARRACLERFYGMLSEEGGGGDKGGKEEKDGDEDGLEEL